MSIPDAQFIQYPSLHRTCAAISGCRPDGYVDSERGGEVWPTELKGTRGNIRLWVDLDPGLGRTGISMHAAALKLARSVHKLGRFAGFYVYAGHISGDREARREKVLTLADTVTLLKDRLTEEKIDCAVIAGGSYRPTCGRVN